MATFQIQSNFLAFSYLFILLSVSYFSARALGDENSLVVEVNALIPSSECRQQGTPEGSSLTLVHKYGPCYKHGALGHQTLSQIIKQDKLRADWIHAKIKNKKNSGKDGSYHMDATTTPVHFGEYLNTLNYIVTVGLGTPKQDVSLAIDTGSSMTWTQCEPCKRCHNQKGPIFLPEKSTSYKNVPCTSFACDKLDTGYPSTCADKSNNCVYKLGYEDHSSSLGIIVTDKLTLGSDDIYSFYFGCGQDQNGVTYGLEAGILGLSPGTISLVFQTALKYGQYFSYCLPSDESKTGFLTFGSGSEIPSSIKFTPMVQRGNEEFYVVQTLGVSIYGVYLDIQFSNIRTLLDSGTVITYMPLDAYTTLRDAYRKAMSRYSSAPPHSILDTCYDFGSIEKVSIPPMSFNFGGNVEIPLAANGIITHVEKNIFCFAFAPNHINPDEILFGNIQQRTYEVVYDVPRNQVGFRANACT